MSQEVAQFSHRNQLVSALELNAGVPVASRIGTSIHSIGLTVKAITFFIFFNLMK